MLKEKLNIYTHWINQVDRETRNDPYWYDIAILKYYKLRLYIGGKLEPV